MKSRNVLVWLCVSLPLIALIWMACFILNLTLPNYGWEIGYFGQFNRVKHVIEEMPDVTIVDHWQHQDITLEDFGFTLELSGGEQVKINFWDKTAPMKERNKERLRQHIELEIREGRTQSDS